MAVDSNRPEQLVAEESVRALVQALAELGGEAAPSELDGPAGLAASTRSKWLTRMREAHLVSGPKGRVQLTPEGWAAAGRLPALPGVQLALAEAIARWPTSAHRAFLRLAISAVVARYHLGAAANGHAGFITAGATGTGKTAVGRFVCDVFGLDPAAAIVGLPDRTGGEIPHRLRRARYLGRCDAGCPRSDERDPQLLLVAQPLHEGEAEVEDANKLPEDGGHSLELNQLVIDRLALALGSPLASLVPRQPQRDDSCDCCGQRRESTDRLDDREDIVPRHRTREPTSAPCAGDQRSNLIRCQDLRRVAPAVVRWRLARAVPLLRRRRAHSVARLTA